MGQPFFANKVDYNAGKNAQYMESWTFFERIHIPTFLPEGKPSAPCSVQGLNIENENEDLLADHELMSHAVLAAAHHAASASSPACSCDSNAKGHSNWAALQQTAVTALGPVFHRGAEPHCPCLDN
jgi:hypothetical protein